MNNKETGITYTPKGIALAVTYACPSMCDHCNIRFNEIDTAEEITADTARRLLGEAKAAGLHAFQIVGGEPTLKPETFVEIVREGRRLSMKCHRPPTNCRIARDEAALRSFFSSLSDAGFSAGFRISVDHFHRRIPLEYTAGFIFAAADYFNLKRFAIGCCDIDEDRSRRMLDNLCRLLCAKGFESRVGGNMLETPAGRIKIGFWAPTRPTWKQLPDSEFLLKKVSLSVPDKPRWGRRDDIAPFGCLGPKGVGYLWVEPSGAVRACCGNACQFIDALVIGNIYDETLGEMIDRARGSELMDALAAGGPVEAALRAGTLDALEKTYTHRCDLCHAVLNDSRTAARFNTP